MTEQEARQKVIKDFYDCYNDPSWGGAPVEHFEVGYHSRDAEITALKERIAELEQELVTTKCTALAIKPIKE